MTLDSLYFENGNWIMKDQNAPREKVNIVFVFADIDVIQEHDHYRMLKEIYPNADIVGNSTSGNILDAKVTEYGAVATAVSFDKSYVKVKTFIPNEESLFEDAKEFIGSFEPDGLKHIFILSRGLGINGSELVSGLNEGSIVSVTGGMAGDGNVYKETFVFANDTGAENLVIAVGFYGESLHIGVGCKGGWEEFGAQRVVTSSKGNVLYEVDNKPALDFYERYLGEYINELPLSGLNFPLSVKVDETSNNEVIRVMMGVNEDGSIVFAGGIPEGSTVRLMKTNVNNLIDGAEIVAQSVGQDTKHETLALVISCTGRLSVLNELVDEEVSAIEDVLGDKAHITGFYSYGEIAPFSNEVQNCQLHNQTITITSIYED